MPHFSDPIEDPAQRPEDGIYYCPVCQDYSGQRTSVEAHITGKSDSDHKGQVGKDYRIVDEDGTVDLSSDLPILRVGDQSSSSPSSDPDPDTDPEPEQPENRPEDTVSPFWAGALLGLVIALLRATGNQDVAESRLREL